MKVSSSDLSKCFLGRVSGAKGTVAKGACPEIQTEGWDDAGVLQQFSNGEGEGGD